MAWGDIIAGPLVRLACERHLEDLVEGPHRGLLWSLKHADRIYGYFRDVLRLNGGQFEGQPFELRLWQAFIVGSLFGWLTAADGMRRFRTAYIEAPKGSGKSPMAGGMGLYALTSDGEDRAEVYAAASTKDQAKVMFRDAVAMIDQSPKLSARLIKYGGLDPWNIFFPQKGSFFRCISSEDKQSGPRPHFALCDEVHEHPNGQVIELLHAGFKFRRQPMCIEITNSGVNRNSICYQHHGYSERILRKQIPDLDKTDSWFAYICGLDKGERWQDEQHWAKANPNLGVSIDVKYLREQVSKAEGMPAYAAMVRRLNFCEWVDAATPWIDAEPWYACQDDSLDIAQYLGSRCWGGLDLSARNDLTALVLDFPRPDGSGTDAFAFFWAPEEGMRKREERDLVPYTVWRDQGYLEATPGTTVDYRYVARRIIELHEAYGLQALAFDRWRIADLCRELDDSGFAYTVVKTDSTTDELEQATGLLLMEHGQGFKDMTPAVEGLTEAITNKEIRFKASPVMTMCSANAVITTGGADEKKFDKRKSTGRIDGIVAAAMAKRCMTIMNKRGASKSFWE